jgi:hypothetical protein
MDEPPSVMEISEIGDKKEGFLCKRLMGPATDVLFSVLSVSAVFVDAISSSHMFDNNENFLKVTNFLHEKLNLRSLPACSNFNSLTYYYIRSA